MGQAQRIIVRWSVICLTGLISTAGYFVFFTEPNCRCGASRTKSDLRSMATAIESYYVDYGRYPESTTNTRQNAFGVTAVMRNKSAYNIPTLRVADDEERPIVHLTSPVAYLSSFFVDVYAPDRRLTYAYWTQPIRLEDGSVHSVGWIAWSPGPDKDYDLTAENIASAYDPTKRVPNDNLLLQTYDPTNGSTSSGDIYRTKQ